MASKNINHKNYHEKWLYVANTHRQTPRGCMCGVANDGYDLGIYV
jgi:hypothetical protein